jgi:NADH-quinone oxidoreductase subunit L
MGVPESLGGGNWIHEFLAPVFAPSTAILGAHPLSHETEYALMGTVVALTLVVIGIAYSKYVRGAQVPAAEGVEVGAVTKTLANKYYIDELYDAIIVKPLYWLSAQFDQIVERLGIDKLVNGVGGSVVAGSRVLRLVQSGSIGYYIFLMVISIVVLIAATCFI